MKYFLSKDELRGTDCHEFFKGKWNNLFWNDDSIYIYDEDFTDTGLKKLFLDVMPEYSPYESTEITPEDWKLICDASFGRTKEAVKDLNDWVQEVFAEYGLFTILGI
ncbi:MAG: hypothetical protein K2L10_11510 [Ruminococcus sp.]|nr:hypothetical protein [Ruminococcus sp.]